MSSPAKSPTPPASQEEAPNVESLSPPPATSETSPQRSPSRTKKPVGRRPSKDEGDLPPLPVKLAPDTRAADSDESGEATPTSTAEDTLKLLNAMPHAEPMNPPLPKEPPPPAATEADDGWSAQWNAAQNAWYFYNRFTGLSQWDNPRIADEAPKDATTTNTQPPLPPQPAPSSISGGYNPAVHGDWDPNAPYAQAAAAADEQAFEASSANHTLPSSLDPDDFADPALEQGAFFNARTGKFQRADQNSERHNDEAKSRRQMGAYFDVDAAANVHDGRSLKAERQGRRPSKKEVSAWKEKRKARKEEKRRAWLRD